MDRLTDLTENRMPISHLAKAGATKMRFNSVNADI